MDPRMIADSIILMSNSCSFGTLEVQGNCLLVLVKAHVMALYRHASTFAIVFCIHALRESLELTS